MNDVSPDDLLEQYLAASHDSEAEQTLARILGELATPLVRRVVASAIRDEDTEDIVADTLLDLLRRLRDLRGSAAQPILDLRRYIVTCAYNRCHERLRERYPARTRLRNQVRYLCNHDRELTLWTANGELVCGFRDWVGREVAGSDSIDDVHVPTQSDPAAGNRAQVAALVPVLLRHANAPLPLDVLASAIARLIGVELQRPWTALSELEAAPEVNPGELLDQRMTLRQLWDDVRRLALKQRIALLLNLRDVHGRECLTLLPLTRTATIAEIAGAVGMPPEAFATLWNRLPLSDAAIGDLLEATPRQVIKLRRLARERLRRMAKSRTDRNLRLDPDSSSNGVTILTRR
jgi:DNA-directed RNA polymerase specialized sigma24 family protein